MSVALAAPVTPAATAATIPHGREATPGAAGIGDSYFPRYGNGGYRVSHYDIDVAYNLKSGRLTGTTTITARARKDLSRFNLDFLLRVTSVEVDGEPARWSRDKRLELVVRPAVPLVEGQRFRTVVSYTGVPEDVRYRGIGGWMSRGRPALALGEPEVAAWWFPSNDHPADKARFDITVRVPSKVEAVSNGRLVSRTTAGDQSVWHWRLGSPAATYLAFVAIGQYDIESGTSPSGRKYLNAYAKSLPDYYADPARRSVRRTPEVTDFLERKFGPYPFGIVGGVVPPHSVGFALENQTRPVYSKWFFGRVNTWIIAHEMAHQWYGDSVAVRRWRHIWLNEGFATYAEWLWESHRGWWSPERTFEAYYRWIGPKNPFWKVPIADPGPRRLFHGAVYARGAMTLQALRNKIGGEDFFRLLQRWAADNRGGNATTAQFIAMAERVSDRRSLDRFFRVWLRVEKRPAPTVANGFPPDFPRFPAADTKRLERPRGPFGHGD